jgi:hypothetical protein
MILLEGFTCSSFGLMSRKSSAGAASSGESQPIPILVLLLLLGVIGFIQD